MKIFILDNYDSFTYNLAHYVEACNVEVTVKRNDKIILAELAEYDKIILSPGPGLPKNAGLMPKVIQKYHQSKPILGVCLGHQALGEFYGATLHNMKKIYHGMSSKIKVDNTHYLFNNLPLKIEVGRYHSWEIKALPTHLIPFAETTNGVNMAFYHTQFPSVGVQFHPESIMTKKGKEIIKNWVFH